MSRLLNTLFPILVSTPSKTFRALLFSKILSDLRSSNAKTTNHRLNRTLQTVLFNLLTSDRTSPKGLWAVKITRELWKRQIWTDARAVEIMKEASLSENEKVIIGGVRFFLGGDKEREEAAEDDSSDEDIDMGKLKHQVGINKKTKKKDRELKKAAAMVKKVIETPHSLAMLGTDDMFRKSARRKLPIRSIFRHCTSCTIRKVSQSLYSAGTCKIRNPS